MVSSDSLPIIWSWDSGLVNVCCWTQCRRIASPFSADIRRAGVIALSLTSSQPTLHRNLGIFPYQIEIRGCWANSNYAKGSAVRMPCASEPIFILRNSQTTCLPY